MRTKRTECGRRRAAGPERFAAAVLFGVVLAAATLAAAQDAVVAEVRRGRAVVRSGPEGALVEILDSRPHIVPSEHLIDVGIPGEARLRLLAGNREICRAFIFRDSTLRLGRDSPTTGRGSFHHLSGKAHDGAALYHDCENHVVETDSAVIVDTGTSFLVAFLPARQLTLVVVQEGAVSVTPILDVAARSLGEAATVPAGFFWFSAPDGTPDAVPGLASRQPQPIDLLPYLTLPLELDELIGLAREASEEAQVPTRARTDLARPDAITVLPDSETVVDVLGNDLGGAELTLVGALGAAHGSVALAGGTVAYRSDADFVGRDVFIYSVSDGRNLDTGTVAVEVRPQVVARDDRASAKYQAEVVVDVLGNDLGRELRIGGVGEPAHGAIRIVGNEVAYTPEDGFSGTDGFDYTVTDGFTSDTGSVEVRVRKPPPPEPERDPEPACRAVDDAVSAGSSGFVEIDVLANDAGAGLEILSVTQPQAGSVSVDGGTVVYEAEEPVAADRFTYTIYCPEVNETSTAAVTLTFTR